MRMTIALRSGFRKLLVIANDPRSTPNEKNAHYGRFFLINLGLAKVNVLPKDVLDLLRGVLEQA
jgi:hypothetical protein